LSYSGVTWINVGSEFNCRPEEETLAWAWASYRAAASSEIARDVDRHA
jgi:hypothetical protein